MNIKSYSELVFLPTFEDRFEYLRLDGIVGETTFGFDRYMNQVFYRSLEWKKIRDTVIARDLIQELRGKRQDVTELCTEAEAVNEPHTGSGIVTDCLYLNVRKLPDINADVAVVIDALTQVCVDLDASTEDFYKVRTSDGVEGFCMRKYIALSK